MSLVLIFWSLVVAERDIDPARVRAKGTANTLPDRIAVRHQ